MKPSFLRLPSLCLLGLFGVTSCSEKTFIIPSECPVGKLVPVMTVSYNDTKALYTVMHASVPGYRIPNPIKTDQLPMVQIEKPKDQKDPFALLVFSKDSLQCMLTLQMSKDYQIQMVSIPGHSGETSMWTPFVAGALMGGMMGHTFSRPAYYSPPAYSGATAGGSKVLSGGTTATSWNEFQSAPKNTGAQKGFFSRSGSGGQTSSSRSRGFFKRR